MSALLDLPLTQRAVLRDMFRIDLTRMGEIGLHDHFCNKEKRLDRLDGMTSATFGEVYDLCGLEVALYALAASDISDEHRHALCALIALEAIRGAECLPEEETERLAYQLRVIGSGDSFYWSDERWKFLRYWHGLHECEHDPDDAPLIHGIELVMQTLAPAQYAPEDAWDARPVQWLPSDCLEQARELRVAAHPAVNAARLLARLARRAQAKWQDGTKLCFDFLGDDVDPHFWSVQSAIAKDIEGVTDYDVAIALGLEPAE